jgi:beta-lactamase superfamily II metal-dependent hydrolase
VKRAVAAAAIPDSYGLVDPSTGIWHLYENGAEATWFYFGNPGDFPFMGDWDCDGIDTPGLYRQSDGYVYLRNSNTQGAANISFFFGNPGDVPIAGDFNSDGCDTVSIYRPAQQRFYIVNELGTNDGGLGGADYSFLFGNPGDKPFTGDFNGNGQDTVGLHRESTGLVYFRNTNTTGNADNQFIFGNPGDRFIAGDWAGDSVDSPGLFRPSNETFYLRHENTQGIADESWPVGEKGWLPVAGKFGDIVPPPDAGGGQFTAMFVAVRQGDSAVFEGACGEMGVIDANRFRTDEILTAIDLTGLRSLKWMAVTHYDADHLGDVVSVATSPGVTVGTFYDRGGDRTVKDTATYRTYYDHVTGVGNRVSLDIGDTFTLCSGIDQVTFTVVSAGTDGTAAGGVVVSEENDRGLCFHVEYHDFDLATCGDINGTDAGPRTDVETPVAAVIGDVEVAKVNHHGSNYSSNTTYVSTLSAEVSIISVGKNSFGHPDATVIARWDAVGDVFQTQSPTDNALIDGDIIITTTGATSYTTTATESSRSISRPMDETTP